ncbi:hypothetical protein [Actinomadura sp. 3N407]|uniref:hypothetical protein n=1 Tax=Actinomadura sp. 3N407 TaxID=3457423 RepID=UPI003FCDD4F9
MDRKRLGFMAVVFVLVVGVMEVLAVKLGSMEVPFPSSSPQPAVADRQGQD